MKRPAILTPRLSVLVVDGYPDTAASLALVLNFQGFAARAALSGEEALAAAAVDPPEMVIFEPRTPGAGWDLAIRLAQPVIGRRCLVVALTTDTTSAGRQAADAAGVGLYLIKPENPAVLVDELRRFERLAGGRPMASRSTGSPSPGRLDRLPVSASPGSRVDDCPFGHTGNSCFADHESAPPVLVGIYANPRPRTDSDPLVQD